MYNIPKIKVGIVAASRDCFPHHGAVAFGHYGKAIYEVMKLLGAEKIGTSQARLGQVPHREPVLIIHDQMERAFEMCSKALFLTV